MSTKRAGLMAMLAGALLAASSAMPTMPRAGKAAQWAGRLTGENIKTEHDARRLAEAKAKRDRKNAKRLQGAQP